MNTAALKETWSAAEGLGDEVPLYFYSHLFLSHPELRDMFPVNILNAIRVVPEVCRIFCATANPVEAVVAQTEQGRAILGVVDGFSPKGIEGEQDIAKRKSFLRAIGYKL